MNVSTGSKYLEVVGYADPQVAAKNGSFPNAVNFLENYLLFGEAVGWSLVNNIRSCIYDIVT